jgi:hypothetical protein
MNESVTPTQKAIIDTSTLARRRRELDARRLSDHSYTQRRAMMLMAAGAFAISWGGIRLSEINVVGVRIGTWDERYLLGFAGLVLSYLIGNFASLVQPTVISWRADFEWFSHHTSEAVDRATSEIEDLTRHARSALGRLPQAEAEVIRSVLKRVNDAVGEDVPERNHAAFEYYRSRLRFEYAVPIGISMFVLYVVVLHLVILAV